MAPVACMKNKNSVTDHVLADFVDRALFRAGNGKHKLSA